MGQQNQHAQEEAAAQTTVQETQKFFLFQLKKIYFAASVWAAAHGCDSPRLFIVHVRSVGEGWSLPLC
jgi:hypothetical protein